MFFGCAYWTWNLPVLFSADFVWTHSCGCSPQNGLTPTSGGWCVTLSWASLLCVPFIWLALCGATRAARMEAASSHSVGQRNS